MTHAYLIVGGNPITRREKIAEIYSQVKPKIKKKEVDPDLIRLEGVNSIGIDEIRQLEHILALKPHSYPPKVAIIEEGEKLTPEAQNALLKTLEEPPRQTVVILASQNMEVFQPTLISRCQIIQLPSKPQIHLQEGEIKKYNSELDSILSSSIGERLIFAEKFKTKSEAIYFCEIQTFLWRELLLQKVQERKGKLLTNEIVRVLKEIQKIKKYLQSNVNVRLAIENLLLAFPQGST